MVKEETVLERVMRFEPEAAVILDTVEDKEALRSDLEKIIDFMHAHELRPGDNKFSHINYAGVARTWYSSLSGRYTFNADALPMLYSSMVKLAELGIPLQLVECRDGRLAVFPLHFDVDVKISSEGPDPATIESEMIDSVEGFRFFKTIVGLLMSIYPEVGELLVFSASGTTRAAPDSSPQKKVSFRLVFPDVIVDKERGQLIWQFLTSRLTALSSEESQFPYVRNLLKRLRQLSAVNDSFQRVIDESVIRCKHGVRMPFSDKIERGHSAGRVLKPLLALKAVKSVDNEKNITLEKIELSDQLQWLELGALTTPSLKHASLTEWNRPSVRSTARVTKTGASGSSLALTRLTTADAARAAERADQRRRYQTGAFKENSEPVVAKYVWPSGSVAEFKRRLRIGLEKVFEENEQAGSVVWRNPKRRNNTVSFNDNNKEIVVTAVNQDGVEYLVRLMADLKDLKRAGAAQNKSPQVQVNSGLKQIKVVATFDAVDQGEVSVKEGEIVGLVQQEDDQWSTVRKQDGFQGFVPTDYLQPIEP